MLHGLSRTVAVSGEQHQRDNGLLSYYTNIIQIEANVKRFLQELCSIENSARYVSDLESRSGTLELKLKMEHQLGDLGCRIVLMRSCRELFGDCGPKWSVIHCLSPILQIYAIYKLKSSLL